jgi:hypothetical protein
VERKNGGGGQRAMMLKSWQAKEVGCNNIITIIHIQFVCDIPETDRN